MSPRHCPRRTIALGPPYDDGTVPALPQAWRYTAERAAAFFSVLCMNWHEGHICTRPAGHKGKHRHSLKVAWQVIEAEAGEALGLVADRLTAIIESRMSLELAWLGDDGETVSMLGPEQAGWHLAHLYETGDVVSGLPSLAAQREQGEEGTDA